MTYRFLNALRCVFYAGVVGIWITSCAETTEDNVNQHTTINTRSIELPISITRMGVSVLNNGQDKDPFSFQNLLFSRVSGQEWQYNGAPPITFERKQSLVTIVAYAPYQENVTYPLLNAKILSDQQTVDALIQSDLIYTYRPNTLASHSIDLQLTHQFTNLRLKVKMGNEYAKATDFKIEKVRLMQFPTTATFNMKDSTLTNFSETSNILPFRDASYPLTGPLAEFQAIVLPQQIALGKNMFEVDFFVNGKSQTAKVIASQRVNLKPGTSPEFEIKIGKDLAIELTDANISMQEWLPGGTLFRELAIPITTLNASQLPNLIVYDIDTRPSYTMLCVTGTMDASAWKSLEYFTNLEYLQLPAGSLCPPTITLNTSYANYMAPHVANIETLRLFDNAKGESRWADINRMVCAIKKPFNIDFEDQIRNIPFTIVPSFSFKDCSLLNSFMATTIDIIGEQAFMNCSQLNFLGCYFIREVQDQAFWGCKSLDKVLFNSTVPMEELGNGAFGNMPKLRQVWMNNSLIKLSKNHFGGTTDTSLIELKITNNTGVSGNTINGIQFKSITIAKTW